VCCFVVIILLIVTCIFLHSVLTFELLRHEPLNKEVYLDSRLLIIQAFRWLHAKNYTSEQITIAQVYFV
jgi:hypothetical protein